MTDSNDASDVTEHSARKEDDRAPEATVKRAHDPRSFSTFSACAIALIGRLPGTLADRSVPGDLVRRKTDEAIEPFRFDRVDHLTVLARKLMRWTKDNAEAIAATEPEMPAGLFNRAADNKR